VKTRVYGLTCVLLLLAISAAHATTIVMPTDEQLIAKSPLIIEGTVLSTTPTERDGRIVTDTTIRVNRAMKGSVPETITVTELGGEVDGRITKFFGTPEFTADERVLLFLEANPRGGYRTMDLFVGKFRDERTVDGRRLWFRDDARAEANLLDANFRELTVENVQRDASGFETYIAERAAGRTGIKNYGVERPRLATFGGITANFELIDEPTVYRWFQFDSARSASWYHHGTQPGYTGGGINELKSAMNSWTGYGSAKIYYSYAGTLSGTAAGLNRPNGTNEVLFNDPLAEISGSYNRSTGGVVGIGGFNGVTNGGTFNATFAADAKHPAGAIRAYNITEGNLTIQDGVSASSGIPSNTLAEIVAHEFGHTLGFGHSADRTALMYASVTGLGPALRSDDQVAARWLYPNGSGPTDPPPATTKPAAPSGLLASVTGSTVQLFWNDNANNETSVGVYLASGTGAFTKVQTLGANDADTTITGLAAGSYRAYVVATNSAGDSAASNIASFTVASTLTVSFSHTPQSGPAGTVFTFYDESRGGTITSRHWTFGDGSSSTAAVANKSWSQPGQYTVTLMINGSQTASKVVTVSASLAASFTFTPASPAVNETVSFSDASTGSITSFLWNFGDGSTSTAQNPTKRYTTPTTYNVTLTVFSNSGQTTVTKSITVRGSAPVTPNVNAAFDGPSTALAGSPVSFADRSTGSPTAWQWNFGDGTSSTAQNPSKTFHAAGQYTVTLRASNATSNSLVSKSISISNQIATFRSLVSAVASTSGAGGTNWRTELSLFNAGSEGANLTLLFLPTSGGQAITRTLFLSPKQSVTYANALVEVFGLTDRGGALTIEATAATSTPQIKVTSRTFTGGPAGTYGQGVPDVAPASLDGTLFLTGVQRNDDFRTNVGVVNRADAQAQVTLQLIDSNASQLAQTTITIPPRTFQQLAVGDLFPSLGTRTFANASMRITTSLASAVSVYASIVDNETQDPIYVQAAAAPSGTSLIVPVIARAPGANGTFWRSDVTIYNTGERRTFTLRYQPTGATRSLSLGSGETAVLADILGSFGLGSGGGALEISWNNGSGPLVTSRTYTTVTGGGTYGQSIDPVTSFATDSFIPGLRNDGSFRSNVGFLNGGTTPLPVTVRLLSPFGTELASRTITLQPKSQEQHSVINLFPGAPANFTLHAQASGNLFAYGSLVDNISGDAAFFAGR
jgi:PKD repeat protein